MIISLAISQKSREIYSSRKKVPLPPEFTEIENLDYFHLKQGIPQMSLTANKMNSQGDTIAIFQEPRGVYNYQKKNETIRYQALKGRYRKKKGILNLNGDVKVVSSEATYLAQELIYHFKTDLMLGKGEVHFMGEDLKTHDQLDIQSDTLRAYLENQFGDFRGRVHGFFQRKKKYEGKLTFASHELQMEGLKSLAHLEGDVVMKRQSYLITAGKADIHLENYNKSLKYFVLNDDVKLTETVETPSGITQRKAFAERLEGFGREEKMVLSGAPRMEQGNDVIKGYRITIREKMDLIEVDDSMSDVQVKREKKPKERP